MLLQTPIYIIGAGAIGKALAVFLKDEGRTVILLRGSVDVASNSIEEITVELSDHSVKKAEIEISSLERFKVLDGIVVLTTKSFGNNQLAIKLQKKINNSSLVILQNGINVEAPFINAGIANIVRCVLFTSCQFISPNRLRFKPAKPSQLGVVRGDSNNLEAITNALNTNHFQFNYAENIQSIIWTKVIVNIVFNSVCPLIETDNGIFQRNSTAFNIASRIIENCVSIAKASGIKLEVDEVLSTLKMISKSSDGQLISTYQDLNNKRRTEIDSLNFALTDIGYQLQLHDLVKEVKLLGELIKLKSELSLIA